jgi:hypothetical protein
MSNTMHIRYRLYGIDITATKTGFNYSIFVNPFVEKLTGSGFSSFVEAKVAAEIRVDTEFYSK